MIEMPVIGKAQDIAAVLKLSPRTVFNMASKKRFARGIYIGGGRFNLSMLKKHIEEHATYLAKAAKQKAEAEAACV